MYVFIPGPGRNKINAAFAFGGAPLLVDTVQGMLGVKVDHVAMIGSEGFKRLTEAVGGLDVYVEEGGKIDGHVFTQGMMHLDGEMALAFVRERYDLSQGDISRGRRQQAFLKALMLEAVSVETLANPAKLATFIDSATSNVIVDRGFDVGQMRGELLSLNGLRPGDIRFLTAPLSGFGRSPYGASIDLVDWVKLTQLGTCLLYTSPPESGPLIPFRPGLRSRSRADLHGWLCPIASISPSRPGRSTPRKAIARSRTAEP